MPKTLLVSRITRHDHRCASLNFALRYTDIVEIDDLFPIREIIALRKQTNRKLLLGLGVAPDKNGAAMRCIAKLKAIVELFDYIELDANCDLVEPVLNVVPPRKRLISWRYNTSDGDWQACSALMPAFDRVSKVEAFLYRFITPSGITALEFLNKINQKNTIAYAESHNELWSRIAAVYKGAAVVFADTPENGPLSTMHLVKQFGLPRLPDINELYGICGYPVTQSLSPSIYNAAFKQLKLPAVYLPFSNSNLDSLLQLIRRLDRIGLNLKGMTVTAPLKESVSRRFPVTKSIISEARSANVLLISENQGQVDTTDGTGLETILCDYQIDVQGKRVAIVGCGGSGRIAARILSDLGARVVLYNRGHWRARVAERLLNLPCRPLNELDLSAVDVIVNTIPFPLSCDVNLPFSLAGLNSRSILIDYTYSVAPNVLITQSWQKGLKVIDGLVMLENQVRSQFQCLTGRNLPESVISDVLGRYRKVSAFPARVGAPGGVDKAVLSERVVNR